MTEALSSVEVTEAEARLLQDAQNAVSQHLQHMGFSTAAIEAVMPQCLSRARKRVGRGPFALEELQRRAVEDVHRRIDRVLGHCLGFQADDLTNLARARAALLLVGTSFPKDNLLNGQAIPPDAVNVLAARLPMATPAEAPLPMKHQTFHFIFQR